MEICVISFTQKGYRLSCEIKEKIQELNGIDSIEIYTKCSLLKTPDTNKSKYTYVNSKINKWAAEQMCEKKALIFIGACGIAVRAIASSVENKLYDSPVIVIDELGKFVIPILSGHVGGANELSYLIAEQINAVPVITTATDINKKFAVDIFAKKNDLSILNKEGIAKISANVLSNEIILVSSDVYLEELTNIKNINFTEYPPKRYVDILISRDKDIRKYDAALYLKPKQYVLGIGCKKNTPYEKIEFAINDSLSQIGIEKYELKMITSIDLKKHEQGINQWCNQNRLDFITYSAEELLSVEGNFSASSFVKEKVGVDNVCERAAVLGGQKQQYDIMSKHKTPDRNNNFGEITVSNYPKLVYKKHIYDGVTIAVAMFGCYNEK